MLLHDIVAFAAAAAPGSLAVVDGGRRWTFADLHESVEAVRRTVSGLCSTGERVVVLGDNTAEYVAALYGVPAAGCLLTFANTRHTHAEIADMVARCGATMLLGTADRVEGVAAVAMPGVRHRLTLEDVGAPGGGSAGAPADPSLDAATAAWLLYTSGTTGRAKGALLTHSSLVSAALNTTMARPVAEDEVYLFPFPLFHVAAYNVVHHHLRRRPVVLLPRFEPVAVMRAIEEHRVTAVSLAPTMLAMLFEHPDRDRFDLSSLRTVSYGAAAMPRSLLERSLLEWPAVGLAQGYGMTELSGNAVFLSPQDHRRAAESRPDLLSAAGRPAPLTALRIVDDQGHEVSPGGIGEILVKGDQVCAGYWDDPEATAAAIADGWLHTGDVGRLDEHGYLHVVDRKKDIIITGGENVASREVEDALSTHPAVSAVAVVGVPDERWGELVCAVVVPRDPGAPPTVEDLRAHAPHLAGFKHPRAVQVVAELPLNASGKVDKVALRSAAGGG